ncbi:MAG: hypothetical protein ACXADY_17900 [Candidatus Hodarchaeales archaeon]
MFSLEKVKNLSKKRMIILGTIIIILGSVSSIFLIRIFPNVFSVILLEGTSESEIICNSIGVYEMNNNFVQIGIDFEPSYERLLFNRLICSPQENNIELINNQTGESLSNEWFSDDVLIDVYGDFQLNTEYQFRFDFNDEHEKVKTVYIAFEYST